LREDMSRLTVFFLVAMVLGAMVQSSGWSAAYCKADSRPVEKVSIRDLVENLDHYDRKEVEIEGEVVGDVMRRGGGAWITVNDDPYSQRSLPEGGQHAGVTNTGIGVWVLGHMVDVISYTGSYKSKGDRVRIRGTFHRVCPQHGGDTDLHAHSLELVERGRPIRQEVPAWKGPLAAALALLALLLWRKMYAKRRKRPGIA